MNDRLIATAISVAAALVVGLPHTANSAGPMSHNVVKIGVLTDMSGIFSELGGKGSVIAAQMAVDDFKKESKPSFEIELISADHQNKADIGANKVREWYDTQQVDLVVDAINSAVAIAASNVTREKKRLLIVTGAGSLRLTNEDCSPNTISYTWDTYATSRPQAAAVTKEGATDWFFLTVDYALGHSIDQDARAAVAAAGGRVVGAARHPINTPDFSSYMIQAQSSKANAVGIASAGGDMINAIKAAREFGLTKNQVLVPLTASISDVHALGLETAQGLLFTEAFYWNQNERSRAWSHRFFEKHKRMPNLIHAGTYSAVKNYLEAVKSSGTDDAAIVRRKLGEIKINDEFTSNGRVREDGRMVHDMYLVQVKKPSESKTPWDYLNIKQVVPAETAFQSLSESRCKLVRPS